MNQISKKDQIAKIGKATGVILGVASFVTAMSVTLAFSLISRFAYQSNVLSQKNNVDKILKKNVESVNKIKTEFIAFDTASVSVLGSADANSKIVLDALPSKYDFPALITSIENFSAGKSYKIESIIGTDEELTVTQEPSGSPRPVIIPISVTVKGDYDSIGQFVKDLERSVRPIKLTNISLSGGGGTAIATVQFVTYFQPGKNFAVTKELIQ